MRKIKMDAGYQDLLEKAKISHDSYRSIQHLSHDDVDLSRLYAYAFRSQTIGTFHSTRVLLTKTIKTVNTSIEPHAQTALQCLYSLENLAMSQIPETFAALIFTLYYYHHWTLEAIKAMERVSRVVPELEVIIRRFIGNIEKITNGRGLYAPNETRVPEQASFGVPNLGITIVPLVYGDHHSWGVAHIPPGPGTGVPMHLHQRGVEIHLGFGHLKGKTILRHSCAEVHDGYAMPIPVETIHGFENDTPHIHRLPFVFGSRLLGGWGIIFDVVPQTVSPSELHVRELESSDMNNSVSLDGIINSFSTKDEAERSVVIPAVATSSPQTGGLELGVARITEKPFVFPNNYYRIISIRRGKARVRIGPIEGEVGKLQHLGLPAGMQNSIKQEGSAPLVTLDSVILPHEVSEDSNAYA